MEKLSNYLIHEGYAETPEMAENIITGMSEEWYNQVLLNE